MAKAKAEYSKPASQVDLEARLESGNKSDLELSTYDNAEPEEDGNARSFALEDNDLSNYIGTDPVYQNYASDALKPGRASEGPEAELEAFAYGETEVHTKAPKAEDEDEKGDDTSDGTQEEVDARNQAEDKKEADAAKNSDGSPDAPKPSTPPATPDKKN